jgi:hypothetical protein
MKKALVVGINQYIDNRRLPLLKTPSEDAEAIAQMLSQYGEFKVERMPKKNNQDRVDPEPVKNTVTIAKLKEALEQLFTPKGEQIPDTALFFFSGHGVRDKNRTGYLATTDSFLKESGVSLQWLLNLLQESPIRRQIIWLDCCHSGEILNFDEIKREKRGYARGFIAASLDHDFAYEEINGKHGILTGALLQGLDPTQQSDGIVNNLTLAACVDKKLRDVIQQPLYHNLGLPITLTRNVKGVVPQSTSLGDEQVLELLERLLPIHFQKVLFLYKIPKEILPIGVPQTEKAIALLEYALQTEGEQLTQLLKVIYKVAPHFRDKA